jgi:hypothetical protein
VVELDQNNHLPPAHRLYSSYIETGAGSEIAKELWGHIPATMGEAYKKLVKIRAEYGDPSDEIEALKKVMKSYHRGLGLLTSEASENIDKLDKGAVEAGQQPYALGGSSLILNKIAYVKTLAGLGDHGFSPLLFVADYDGVQAELLNTRVPSPSPRGLLMSYPAGPELEGSPIYELPNPPEGWLLQIMEKLRGNYRGLLRDADANLKERLLLNLEHALSTLRAAYYSTENVSDWATKTVGTLVNLEADLGVPILPFSMPGSRGLYQSGYELLLAEPNRTRFIEAANGAVELVEALGYRPGIGRRDGEYVPFFLECPSKGCHRTRVELGYRRETGSSTAHAAGRCPKCGETHEFSFNAGKPDLSDVVGCISPRVDSRQMIVDSTIPVLAHVGGPGETSYYSEVIPAARALGLPFPAYLRYTRLFYNTPWNEAYAGLLKEKGHPTLIDERLFEALSGWVEARNTDDSDRLKEAHVAIRGCIEATAGMLEEILAGLRTEIEGIKQRLKDPGDRRTLIKEMREKQAQAQQIELYMSSALGRFSPERFGQEVSWAWLDVAVVAGVGDLMGVFLRQYNENTPNSSMFFANL